MGVTIESYGKVEISYINVDNFYMDNDRDIKVDKFELEEQFCVFKIFEISAIFKMAAKIRHKKWSVKIQHCPISSKFYMWVDNDVPN